ncbi:transporter substrate-binding domain-containing protein [Pseudaeromonas sp. ZJS20]|uniref:substrate-binding periplasmic protein n=1 Tax=Pseudaeromonas aegiceratis TaxID=3153928 RepID=UPI00390C726B
MRLRSARCPWGWLALWGLLFWPLAQATEPQVVCASISPFAFEQQGGYRGYAYELGQEVMRRLGYGGQIRVLPLARANRTVQTEANVIGLWVGRIPEREQTVHWLHPILRDAFSVYTLKGQPTAATLEEARRIGLLGANIGAANAIAAQRQGLTRLELINSDDANGRKLLVGRLQGWISVEAAVNYFIRLHGLPDNPFVKGLKLSDYQAWVVASLETDPAIRAQWQTTLAAMEADGSLQRLAERYGVLR